MNYTETERAVIWLDSFLSLDYNTKHRLLEHSQSLNIYENLSNFHNEIATSAGEEVFRLMERNATEKYITYILGALEKRGLTMVTRYSENYPTELLNIPTPPLVLYCKGNLSLLSSEKKFAIVGSRRTLPFAAEKCREFSRVLSQNGFTIVSGMAQGADSCALDGALESGNVITVIASGIDEIYPEQNRPLVEKVAKYGLMIGEHNPGIKSKPYLFPIRNRIIAGLCKGTLVVSGSEKSGTLYTANFAHDFDRDVFAFPYNIGVESGMGCNKILRDMAMLVTKPTDILEAYGIELVTNEKEKDDFSELTAEESEIIKTMQDGDIHIEKIAETLNRSAAELFAPLMMLEIKGKIKKNAGNVYTKL